MCINLGSSVRLFVRNIATVPAVSNCLRCKLIFFSGGVFNDNCFLVTEHRPMFKEPMPFLKAVCVLFGAFYVLNLPIQWKPWPLSSLCKCEKILKCVKSTGCVIEWHNLDYPIIYRAVAPFFTTRTNIWAVLILQRITLLHIYNELITWEHWLSLGCNFQGREAWLSCIDQHAALTSHSCGGAVGGTAQTLHFTRIWFLRTHSAHTWSGQRGLAYKQGVGL